MSFCTECGGDTMELIKVISETPTQIVEEYRCHDCGLIENVPSRKGKMSLKEALIKEHETYQRLIEEIEEGRRNEAAYWKFLDKEDE